MIGQRQSRRRRAARSCAAIIAAITGAGAASAQPAASSASATTDGRNVFTTLDLKACKRVTADKDGGRWACGGPKGFEVLFSEGDLRQFIAYGAKAREQRAATQTLGPFNSIFKEGQGRDRTVIQWRGTMQGATFVPFATIVRYHIDTGDAGAGDRKRSQILVVTKLTAPDSAEACHVAYIDAIANTDANALANTAADEMARRFDCRKEPSVVGKPGGISLVPGAKI